jgi:hypothetical protein
VVAGDPGGGVGVEHVGPVSQPQHELAAVRPDPHPKHGVEGQRALVADRIEHDLEGRPGQAELTPEIADREILVG